MVLDGTRARGKDASDFSIALALDHPMEGLTGRKPYLLQILRSRDRPGSCSLQRGGGYVRIGAAHDSRHFHPIMRPH